MDEKVLARFWSKIDKYGPIASNLPTRCWNWRGATSGKGYGVMCVTRKRGAKRLEYAHRLSVELLRGVIPGDKVVLHKCDNPPCCNPEHLLVGTQQENILDMFAKGRGRRDNPARGERQHLAKMTEEKVRLARKLRGAGISFRKLAIRFGMSKSAMRAAVVGETWKHL
jgi:hypothetical protein